MTTPKSRKMPAGGRLIGYARVSTDDQGTDPQLDELRAVGCATILEEHASGADRGRPVLIRLLKEIRPGETLVVVRLDRLARSVSHLLAVIEQLEDAGAHFRSLRDPIDTTTPQGMFSLQVLGAVAQLERALIAERTKAGLRAARSRGRIGGNPGLRAHDPDAIRKARKGRDAAYLDAVLAQADAWLPIVRRMRPDQPWGDVVRVLNRGQTPTHGQGKPWTVERLRRTVRRLARDGLVENSLLDRARPQHGDDRLVRLVAGIKAAAPDRTLQQIAAQLEAMRERTPRGGTRWHPSSVKHLLTRAERLGLAGNSAAALDPSLWR
ncbi:MAG: recombinase family protein [Opitutaceae bacterium]|nr:recombinase family protein [Opitutaceae bacterium]